MSRKFSKKLIESVEQAAEIMRGTRPPSRVFHVTTPEHPNECPSTREKKPSTTSNPRGRAADDGCDEEQRGKGDDR